MSSQSDPRVVLHPGQGSAMARAFEAIPGIRLETPEWEAVARSMAGAPVLVTYLWDDAYLTGDLRWVQSVSAGTEQFPLRQFAETGVVLTSASGVHGPQVGEHAIALLLAMTRGVGPATLQRSARAWEWPPVVEVGGLTMGIIGLGAIGEAVAQRAAALGMRVIGTKRDVSGYQGAADALVPAEQMDEVFEKADVVVVTLPGGEATRGMIGTRQLAALGDGWFINVGRGSVVDEQALVAALTGGSLRGAGLDVFETEPLPDRSPLWDLPNVVMTPHMAGSSPRYGERLADLFRTNLAAYRTEGEWINRVV